jgi:hypothetical protein
MYDGAIHPHTVPAGDVDSTEFEPLDRRYPSHGQGNAGMYTKGFFDTGAKERKFDRFRVFDRRTQFTLFCSAVNLLQELLIYGGVFHEIVKYRAEANGRRVRAGEPEREVSACLDQRPHEYHTNNPT